MTALSGYQAALGWLSKQMAPKTTTPTNYGGARDYSGYSKAMPKVTAPKPISQQTNYAVSLPRVKTPTPISQQTNYAATSPNYAPPWQQAQQQSYANKDYLTQAMYHYTYDGTAGPQSPAKSSGGGGSRGSSGGGGGGGGSGEVKWSSFNSGVANAPSWWKALKPSSVDPQTSYLAAMNMMIPFLSPEDQRSIAATLYQTDSKNFGHLAPDKIGAGTPPAEINGDVFNQYTNQAHFQSAMDALNALMSATGKKAQDMGAGFKYLQSVLATGKQYGGVEGNPQTRGQYLAFQGALDPLASQGKSDALAAYAPLERALSQPFFSNGQLMPVQKTASGNYVFGTPNAALF